MYQVLITFAETPKPGFKALADYPLAVVVITPDGVRHQDHLVRSVRDGRLFANGICAGSRYAKDSNQWPVNPTLDERLKDVA